MNRSLNLAGRCLLVCAAAAATSANAQGTQAWCPDVAEQLQQSLRSVVQQVGESAWVQVELAQHNGRLSVATQGGPAAYQRALRRALRTAGCRAPADSSAPLRFVVRFVDPWTLPAGHPVEPVVASASAGAR
jgi:hypothetical protein